MISEHFLSDDAPLALASAVAAILLDDTGRYLLQRRDDIPRIWYPGHWGFVGGAIEPGESPIEAMARELVEEVGLALAPPRFTLFLRYDFALAWQGRAPCERYFFTAALRPDEVPRLRLGEGAEMRFVTGEEALGTLPLVPYDSFGLFLHHARHRLR